MEITFFMIALCLWAICVGVRWTHLAFKQELNAEKAHYDFLFCGIVPRAQRKWLLGLAGAAWTVTFSMVLIAVLASLLEMMG